MHNSVQLLFLSASIVLRFLSSGKVGLIGYLLPIIFLLILTKHISQSQENLIFLKVQENLSTCEILNLQQKMEGART